MSGISIDILGQTVQADFAAVYKTRADLAAITAAAGDVAFLAEPGREGNFIYKADNLSAAVSSDTLQGLYLAPAVSPTGSAGAWVRVWDQINGYPEWFYSGDWANAIEACYKLCPVTLLGRKDYYFTRTIKLNTPWRTVRGQGGVAYDGNQGTRLVFGSGSGDAMQVGPDANPGGNPGVTFLRGVQLDNFQLTRGATLVPASSIAASPTGLRCQFLYDCDIDVYSFESSVGCQIKGCVFSRISCTYERAASAITNINDVSIGTYIDTTTNIGLAGGNASLTIRALSSIPNTTSPTRIGVYAYGMLADTIFDYCETVGGATGMLLKATGTAANNVDIRLIIPTLDQPANRPTGVWC